MPKIGFKVLQGPHVGAVYKTHNSLGLSWYNFLSAYCSKKQLKVNATDWPTVITSDPIRNAEVLFYMYLALVLCPCYVKTHFYIPVCNFLLYLFSYRLLGGKKGVTRKTICFMPRKRSFLTQPMGHQKQLRKS